MDYLQESYLTHKNMYLINVKMCTNSSVSSVLLVVAN